MTVGVFFGSQSPEHEVSIITGQLIISELLNLGHSVVAIYLTKNCQWLVQKLDQTTSNISEKDLEKPANFDAEIEFKSNPQIQKLRTGLLSLATFGNLKSENWIDKDWQNWDLNLSQSQGKLVLTKKMLFKTQKIDIDLVVPALHGSFGEDGTIQGLLEMMKVPYVGCNVTSSSIGMDKILSKVIAQSSSVPTAKFVAATKIEIQHWSQNFEVQGAQSFSDQKNNEQDSELSALDKVSGFLGDLQKSTLGQKFNPGNQTVNLINSKEEFMQKVEKELSYPVFVKPPRLGSSIGITKAHNHLELSEAIDLCLYYDEQILVESAVANLADLTCCVIEKATEMETYFASAKVPKNESATDNQEKFIEKDSNFLPKLKASLVQESLYTTEMFSFQDKYLSGGGSQTGNNQKALTIPAQIPEEITAQIQKFSKVLFAKMGCSGIARFDFLLDRATGKVYFSEVNVLPGNFYKHLWQVSGVSFGALLTNLIMVAKQNAQSQKNLTYTFDSNLIQIANSSKMGGKGKM